MDCEWTKSLDGIQSVHRGYAECTVFRAYTAHVENMHSMHTGSVGCCIQSSYRVYIIRYAGYRVYKAYTEERVQSEVCTECVR